MVPTYHAVHTALTHAAYAGADVSGRTRGERYVTGDGELRTRRRRIGRDDWEVCIPDHHPGFLDWDGYLANPAADRQEHPPGRPPARHRRRPGGLRPAAGVPGRDGRRRGDRCLAAARDLQDGHHSVLEQHRREVQRARYDTSRAEHRYLAVDAENRLVARGLETAWERALTALAAAEAELTRREAQQPKTLTAEQHPDPRVGHRPRRDLVRADHHRPDRKELLATLLTEVTITLDRPAGHADLVLRWKGGALTDLRVPLTARTSARLRTAEDTIDLVRRLAVHYPDAQIAGILNRQNRSTANRTAFTAGRVQVLRHGPGDAGMPSPVAEPAATHCNGGQLHSVTYW